ncbi:hypothetical protein ACLOJK_027030 [Asimina triloba]
MYLGLSVMPRRQNDPRIPAAGGSTMAGQEQGSCPPRRAHLTHKIPDENPNENPVAPPL